jgi:hypothetical protein
MDNHPTFPERIKLLKATAEDLRDLAQDRNLRELSRDIADELYDASNTVMSEVLHMEAAQKRFDARKGPRTTPRASR